MSSVTRRSMLAAGLSAPALGLVPTSGAKAIGEPHGVTRSSFGDAVDRMLDLNPHVSRSVIEKLPASVILQGPIIEGDAAEKPLVDTRGKLMPGQSPDKMELGEGWIKAQVGRGKKQQLALPVGGKWLSQQGSVAIWGARWDKVYVKWTTPLWTNGKACVKAQGVGPDVATNQPYCAPDGGIGWTYTQNMGCGSQSGDGMLWFHNRIGYPKLFAKSVLLPYGCVVEWQY